MKNLILAASLVLAIPAAALAAEGASASKDSQAPYPDPWDGMIRTFVRPTSKPVTVPGAPIQNDINIHGAAPKPQDQKADRPLGMG